MRPLSFALLFLFLLTGLIYANDTVRSHEEFKKKNIRDFNHMFSSAVDDTGIYMAQLESQQLIRGMRYTKERQLSIHMNMLETFYSNLALKFGVEGDPYEITNIMLHIPAMLFIEHDGYRLVTVVDQQNGSFTPTVHPKKQFYYKTELGYVVYFTTDDNVIVFDPSTAGGQYLEGPVMDILTVRDLRPIVDYGSFVSIKARKMSDIIKEEMMTAIEVHNTLMNRVGRDSTFYMPMIEEDFEIRGSSFYAFIQGYPMPGGELLSSYAFGSSEVGLRNSYTGTILASGMHLAYGRGCTIPSNSLIIETLFNDQEAARKGYFIKDCD